uniref:Secreted protein n=1 Tax=Haptolina brevifila TaxID=156173 RepID=A0A7S2GLB6_9EUKA|mmetsp:Transcript_39787/g.79533  ORF Transcript_39787/g.79533 Transcript_39787/m.79533 type:complete len:151 (+) Transcript_39787:1-453(+)
MLMLSAAMLMLSAATIRCYSQGLPRSIRVLYAQVIWLHRSECETLQPSDRGVMCGKHPHLYPCDMHAAGFVGLSKCGRYASEYFSAPYRRMGFPGTMDHRLPGQLHMPLRGAEHQEPMVRQSKCATSCFPSPLPGQWGWSRSTYLCATGI